MQQPVNSLTVSLRSGCPTQVPVSKQDRKKQGKALHFSSVNLSNTHTHTIPSHPCLGPYFSLEELPVIKRIHRHSILYFISFCCCFVFLLLSRQGFSNSLGCPGTPSWAYTLHLNYYCISASRCILIFVLFETR